MICVSPGNWPKDNYKVFIDSTSIIEIRLDLNDYSSAHVQEICRLPIKKIFTCRPGKFSEDMRLEFMLTAIQTGIDYIDIELDAEDSYKRQLINAARTNSCKIIISYHNYKETPPPDQLELIVKACLDEDADIAKIACQVNSVRDTAQIMALYGKGVCDSCRLLAIGMGDRGKITRIAPLFLGAPFTYASASTRYNTAPGQMDQEMMKKILGIIGYDR